MDAGRGEMVVGFLSEGGDMGISTKCTSRLPMHLSTVYLKEYKIQDPPQDPVF